MSILFINACVRKNSRTLVLARNMMKDLIGEITELNLNMEDIAPLNTELLEKRDGLLKEGKLDDPMFRYARQFADADAIVIAAPFWQRNYFFNRRKWYTWIQHQPQKCKPQIRVKKSKRSYKETQTIRMEIRMQ